MKRHLALAAIALAASLATTDGQSQPSPGPGPVGEAAPQLFLAALSVADLDRSISFYRDHLGFSLIERNRYPDHNMEIAFLAQGAFRLELVALAGSVRRQAPDPSNDASLRGIAKLGFAVPDLELMVARLRAGGLAITLLPSTLPGTDSGGLVRDPDGNLIGLYQLGR